VRRPVPPPDAPASANGPPPREPRFEPLPGTLGHLARNSIRAAAGTPFQREIVSGDIARLNRLGRFRQIEAHVQLFEDGSVAVIFTLAEHPVVQDVQVVGNRELHDQDILQAAGVITGVPVDRFQLDRAARAIEDLYRGRGFYRARVEIDEQVLEDSAIVVFRIIEGQRTRVSEVHFEGHRAFSNRELRSQIRTTRFIPIIERAPLDDDVLREDAAALVRFYRDRGYLDIRTGTRIQPSPDGREAIVTFIVDEGPLYTLRSISALYANPDAIAQYRREILQDPQAPLPHLTAEQMRQIGRRPFSDEQITGLMVLKPGDVYSDDKLRRSLASLEDAYAKLGAVLDTPRGPLPARIAAREIRDERRPEIDLLIIIEEGMSYLTGEIIVTGNELTQQKVIMRQVQVRPERPLDLTALEESRQRLEGLRLFQPRSVRITLQPPRPGPLDPPAGEPAPAAGEPPDDPFRDLRPQYRDVLVEVQETSTGEFNFGVEYNPDAGVIGRIAVTQRNFDLLDFPDSPGELFTGRAFRGAGQTAGIELLPGNRIQTYSVSLSEPYFLESDYSLSGRLFYRKRLFRQYDEERYGLHTSLGRRFGTVWTGHLTVRNDWIDLSDISPDAPVDYLRFEDRQRLDGVGIRFIRNTIPPAQRFRPAGGSRLDLGVEQLGLLFGDFDFTKLSAEYNTFFTLYESFLGYRTILKLDLRANYIPQGQHEAPVYERYFLGGQTFRGFGFRAVSPMGRRADGTLTRDPVGGTWLWFAGAEIQQPLYRDIVSIAGFIDTGTVEENFGFDDYRVSIGFGFRLLVPISPVPLAFDFGFPVMREDTDRRRLFTFSFDVPFN
jgi:outer membrane protein insertion porin family